MPSTVLEMLYLHSSRPRNVSRMIRIFDPQYYIDDEHLLPFSNITRPLGFSWKAEDMGPKAGFVPTSAFDSEGESPPPAGPHAEEGRAFSDRRVQPRHVPALRRAFGLTHVILTATMQLRLSPAPRRGNTERLSDLPKVTKPFRDGAKIQTYAAWLRILFQTSGHVSSGLGSRDVRRNL